MEDDARHPSFAVQIEALEAADWASLTAIDTPESLRDEQGRLGTSAILTSRTYPLANRVIGLGLERPVQAAVLDRVLQLYEESEVDSVFLPMPPARPSSLPRMLRERHFESWTREAKLYRSGLLAPPPESPKTITEATAADRDTVLALYRAGGIQGDWAEIMAANDGREQWRHFIAWSGGQPVALASLFTHDGLAMCFPSWALPDYRQSDMQGALMARRIRAATETDCRWIAANLDITEGRRLTTVNAFRRFEFDLLYTRTTYVRHRVPSPRPQSYTERMLVP